MIDPEQKRKGIESLVKWGVIAVVLAATASIATWVVEGLIAWSILGVVAMAIMNFAPAVATWFANKKIQALIAVIEANPIETMQNLYVEKQQELNQQAEAVRDFDTELRNVTDLVNGLKKTDPEEAIAYAEMRDKMAEGFTELTAEQQAATGELENFKTKIDKARRIYKVAQAMNHALEKSQSAQAQVFADIKEQVSFDKVRTDLNRAFSNLNSAVERRKNASLFKTTKTQPALPEAKVDVSVIDITPKRIGVSR